MPRVLFLIFFLSAASLSAENQEFLEIFHDSNVSKTVMNRIIGSIKRPGFDISQLDDSLDSMLRKYHEEIPNFISIDSLLLQFVSFFGFFFV